MFIRLPAMYKSTNLIHISFYLYTNLFIQQYIYPSPLYLSLYIYLFIQLWFHLSLCSYLLIQQSIFSLFNLSIYLAMCRIYLFNYKPSHLSSRDISIYTLLIYSSIYVYQYINGNMECTLMIECVYSWVPFIWGTGCI